MISRTVQLLMLVLTGLAVGAGVARVTTPSRSPLASNRCTSSVRIGRLATPMGKAVTALGAL